jgi:hypothetical protein
LAGAELRKSEKAAERFSKNVDEHPIKKGARDRRRVPMASGFPRVFIRSIGKVAATGTPGIEPGQKGSQKP